MWGCPVLCCVGATHVAHIPFLSYMCLVVLAAIARTTFPLSGGSMHRRGVQKSRSVGAFKGRVGKTDRLNLQRNRRGGIRL